MDEASHAALAWEVADWLEPQLSPEERRCIFDARARAFCQLVEAAAVEPDAVLVSFAGLPTSSEATRLLAKLAAVLPAPTAAAA
jgi:hypothetical protein